ARANVQDVSAANLRWTHLADGNCSGGQDCGHSRSEKLNRWNQNQIGEYTARAHDRSDARTDDVTNAQERRRDFGGDRTGLKGRAENFFRRVLPTFEAGHENLIKKAHTQTREDCLRAHLLRLIGDLPSSMCG